LIPAGIHPIIEVAEKRPSCRHPRCGGASYHPDEFLALLPGHDGHMPSLLGFFSGIKEKRRSGFVSSKPGPVIQGLEKSRRHGEAGSDFQWCEMGSLVDQGVDFISRAIAPEVEVGGKRPVVAGLELLAHDPGLEQGAPMGTLSICRTSRSMYVCTWLPYQISGWRRRSWTGGYRPLKSSSFTVSGCFRTA